MEISLKCFAVLYYKEHKIRRKQTRVYSLGANNTKSYFEETAERIQIFLASQLLVLVWLQNTISFDDQVKESYAHTFKVLYIPSIPTESNKFSYSDMIYLFKANLGSHAGWQESFFP